jgi:hypothetical protein
MAQLGSSPMIKDDPEDEYKDKPSLRYMTFETTEPYGTVFVLKTKRILISK